MKDIGAMTRRTEKEDLSMPMETFMKETGLRIKLMAKVAIHITMEQSMTEIGLKISNMVLESKLGPMVLDTRVVMWTERSTEKDCLNGQMDRAILESFMTTTYTAQVQFSSIISHRNIPMERSKEISRHVAEQQDARQRSVYVVGWKTI